MLGGGSCPVLGATSCNTDGHTGSKKEGTSHGPAAAGHLQCTPQQRSNLANAAVKAHYQV
jgi:hypothetical protein